MVIDKTTEEFKANKRKVSREWYEKNKEKKLDYMREYWNNPKNAKRNTARVLKWRNENRDLYNKYQREFMRKVKNLLNNPIKSPKTALKLKSPKISHTNPSNPHSPKTISNFWKWLSKSKGEKEDKEDELNIILAKRRGG